MSRALSGTRMPMACSFICNEPEPASDLEHNHPPGYASRSAHRRSIRPPSCFDTETAPIGTPGPFAGMSRRPQAWRVSRSTDMLPDTVAWIPTRSANEPLEGSVP